MLLRKLCLLFAFIFFLSCKKSNDRVFLGVVQREVEGCQVTTNGRPVFVRYTTNNEDSLLLITPSLTTEFRTPGTTISFKKRNWKDGDAPVVCSGPDLFPPVAILNEVKKI